MSSPHDIDRLISELDNFANLEASAIAGERFYDLQNISTIKRQLIASLSQSSSSPSQLTQIQAIINRFEQNTHALSQALEHLKITEQTNINELKKIKSLSSAYGSTHLESKQGLSLSA